MAASDGSGMMTAALLIYSPARDEAAAYADLVRRRHPKAHVTTASSADEAAGAIDEAEIVLGWKFPPGLFERAAKLRWVHKISAGVEDLAAPGALPAGVRLTRSDGAGIAPRMVEYVLGAIYATTQNFALARRQQAERRWAPYQVDLAEGTTVGVAGLGDIGSEVARRLAVNGMRVVGWRRSAGAVEGVERVYAGKTELGAFVGACDHVVMVLPATPETDRLFTTHVFEAMRATATLINVGRGNAVDEAALVAALRAGHLAGAFLDVFAEEPLPASSPLWDLPQVTITPHVAGPIIPEAIIGVFFDNLERFADGRPFLREVDLRRGY